MTSTFQQEHPDAALARTPAPPKLVDITHPWNRAPPKPIDKRRRYCSIRPGPAAAALAAAERKAARIRAGGRTPTGSKARPRREEAATGTGVPAAGGTRPSGNAPSADA
ncbi:hypothetical protein ACIBTP_38335 [Streptomyces avidinii]|uniref:hypothetical protein n=1 Tax=Streptomyces avidinii TaxID=1895 RepID=UPI003799EDC5